MPTDLQPGHWVTYTPWWTEKTFEAVFLYLDDERPDRAWIQIDGKRTAYPMAVYVHQLAPMLVDGGAAIR